MLSGEFSAKSRRRLGQSIRRRTHSEPRPPDSFDQRPCPPQRDDIGFSQVSIPTNHKTLYLHIGSEKTGTTSIQVALTTYSEALRQYHGVYYPVRTPLFLDTAHFPLIGGFLEPDELDFVPPPRRLSIADVRQSLQLLAAEKCHSMILSTEHFSSRLPFSKLAILKDILKEALPDYSVKIIYYVRSQPSLHCSRISTFVKAFGTDWPKPKDIKSDDRYYNYLHVASEWAREFGRENIQVLNFHQGDAVSMFAAATGIELPLGSRSQQFFENSSLSYEECRLLECFNSLFEPLDWKGYEGVEERIRLRKQFLNHVRSLPILQTPLSSMLTEGDFDHFMCEFRESNDRLQESFNLDFNLNHYICEMKSRATEGARLERARLMLESESKVSRQSIWQAASSKFRMATAGVIDMLKPSFSRPAEVRPVAYLLLCAAIATMRNFVDTPPFDAINSLLQISLAGAAMMWEGVFAATVVLLFVVGFDFFLIDPVFALGTHDWRGLIQLAFGLVVAVGFAIKTSEMLRTRSSNI